MAETTVGHNILDYEWPCPSCTFINKPGSFKCHMCKTPKGTATRQVKSSVSALEIQYATETAIKAHNLRLKAAAAAAANQIQISCGLSTGGMTTTTTTLNTSSAATACHSACINSSVNASNQPSHFQVTGSFGTTGQKRRQRSKTSHNFPNGSVSSGNSLSKNSQNSKLPNSTKRVKRTHNITIDGVTVPISEIDTILCSDSD